MLLLGGLWANALVGQHDYAGLPVRDGYPNKITILVNTAYTVGYDETYRNPAWVCYYIPPDRKHPTLKRRSTFLIDKKTKARVSHDDYTNSGWDRGHMCPNYAIASRFGVNAQRETFFMSNVVPQAPSLNQQIWEGLEDDVANNEATNRRGVWVITGPLYDDHRERVRRTKIELPDGFFKIITDFDEETNETKIKTVIVWQEDDSEHKYKKTDLITNKTIDEIEELAGLDFLPMLDDKTEEELEAGNATWALTASP